MISTMSIYNNAFFSLISAFDKTPKNSPTHIKFLAHDKSYVTTFKPGLPTRFSQNPSIAKQSLPLKGPLCGGKSKKIK